MKTYTLKKISGTPDWDTIPELEINVPYRIPADIEAWGKLCWDDTGIHVNLRAREEHIRCEETGPLPRICRDSCLEFFFRPSETMAYFNFEFNPACGLTLGHGWGIHRTVRLTVPDEKATFNPESYRTADGWGITYHVPFTFIQHFFPDFKAYEGLELYGNCYKCGDLTVQPHYLSWNPIELERLTFHSPQFFGKLIFGGKNI